MKSFKKLIGVALAMIMALALMVPAMAADLTVTNANKDETYDAYKILNATIKYTDENKTEVASISYTAATGWDGFLATSAAKAVLTEVTPATTPASYKAVTGVTDNSDAMKAFATAALAYAEENEIAPAASNGGFVEYVENETTKYKTTIENLDPGYYVIDSTMGTVCMVQTADGILTINEKNEVTPPPTKTQDTSAVTNGVGDVITYTVEVEVKAGADNYILHDTMRGLDFNADSISAKVKDSNPVENVNLIPQTPATGETFAYKIDNVGNYAGKTIVVTYTATINANAVSTNEVTNDASLSYGDNSTFTTGSQVKYELGQITINKWALAAGDGDLASRRTALKGAQFKLYHSEDSTDAISLVLENGVYRPAKTGETGTDTIDMTEADTMIVKGLKEGTYWLEESKAPAGYNKLTARQSVELRADKGNDQGATTVTVTDNIADVDNQTGVELPSTGGIGTTIFYTLGGLLLVGSVILFVTKKRTGMAG